jgi:hypothetical protein
VFLSQLLWVFSTLFGACYLIHLAFAFLDSAVPDQSPDVQPVEVVNLGDISRR